jgi:hypothetical protein
VQVGGSNSIAKSGAPSRISVTVPPLQRPVASIAIDRSIR